MSAPQKVRVVALLGFADPQVDAVEAYCRHLATALGERGHAMEVLRVPVGDRGWVAGLRWLWKSSKVWRGCWIIVQYTALQWSRRGFSFPVLGAFAVLRMRGARRVVVLHDAYPWEATSFAGRLRRRCQTFVMRSICSKADRVIATIAPQRMPWIKQVSGKCVTIPVGSNLTNGTSHIAPSHESTVKTVAVFSLSGGAPLQKEIQDVAYVIERASDESYKLKLVVLGRNSEKAEAPLRALLAERTVDYEVLGFLGDSEASKAIAAADAVLFMRGEISSRRGSTVAAVVLGVPVIAYEGPETAPPITEAGVMLAPMGDRDALAAMLRQVLTDKVLLAELKKRNQAAYEQHFSWQAIAQKYIECLELR